MPNRKYSGCEGFPDDGLQKVRERLSDSGGKSPRDGLELGSAEQHAERQRLQRRDASTYDRTGEQRGRGCSG
jgi:hypothetical protein